MMLKNKNAAKNNPKLITNFLNLPVEQKACLFILFMGVVGVVLGGITAEMEIRGCTEQQQCFVVDADKKRLDGMLQAAFGGMGTALFVSLPALMKRWR